jgi:GTPase SAR1 family protein
MKEINDHIIEYLDYYCGLPYPPKFAVLIKGEWGSGKTWLVEKYIKGEYKQDETYSLGSSPQSSANFSEKNPKPIYISLYGVASLSEIDDLIFSQLHPILSSKALKLGSKFLVGAVKATIKVDLNSDGDKDESLAIQIPEIKLPEYLKNTNKCLFVFDDLERCNIEIISLLGYINYFVEHQKLKVIVIANEDEINNNTDDYKKTKEKLIGKTFSVKTDFNGALIYFIKDIQNKDIKSFLEKNSGLIKNFFDNAKCQNLRTLHQIILDFERIYTPLPPKALGKEILLQDLLKMLMCLSLEIKRNAMSQKDIVDLFEASTNLQTKNYLKQQGKNLEEARYEDLRKFENLEPIIKMYSQLDFSSPYPSLDWWRVFFDIGKINREYLSKSIDESKYFIDENTPKWKKLLNHQMLSDEEFDNYLQKVKQDFDDKNFDDIGIFIHITFLLIHLSEIDLFEREKSEILEEAIKYIQNLEDNHDLILKSSLLSHFIEDNFQSYHQHGFYGRGTDDFMILTSSLIKAFNNIKKASFSEEAEELLDIMKDDPVQFYYMICLDNNFYNRYQNVKRYDDIPIFTHLTSQKIVDKFLKIDSYKDQQWIFWGLKARYQFVKKNNGSTENKFYTKNESEQKFDQDIINNLAMQPESGLYTSNPINQKPDVLLEELDILKEFRALLLEESERKKGKNSGNNIKTLVDRYLNEIIANLENCLPQKEESL